MLYPKQQLCEVELKRPGILDLIFYVLKQLSDEEFLGEGRTYGGGLSKLEPRELGRIQLALEEADLDVLERENKAGQLDLFAHTGRNSG
jgi:hypothetical protein